MKRFFSILFLIVIYQTSVCAGFHTGLCVAHEPCHSGHEADHAAQAILAFYPDSGLQDHFHGSSDTNTPPHCACACPKSADKPASNYLSAVIQSTWHAHPDMKLPHAPGFEQYNILHGDWRSCYALSSDDMPSIASLEHLCSVLLLI